MARRDSKRVCSDICSAPVARVADDDGRQDPDSGGETERILSQRESERVGLLL